MWVTKVQGDTSNLSKLGSYAFSWANSPGGYTLDIRLDYPGEITVGKEIFNHMNVTARIRHATGFSRTSFSQQSLNYVFTDAHICGEPTWSWNDNHTSATGTFICTDPRCRHEETVDASIVKTSEEGKDVYTATAVLGDSTYTDTKTVYTDGIGACLVGHSVSLDGDIAVNFFMELSPEVLTHEDVYMQFTVPDSSKEYQEQKVYVRDLTPVVSDGKTWYVFKCRVAAKNMESEISAQLIDRNKVSTVYKYSVRQYADYLLDHINDNAEYAKAAELVRKMLNYGSYAANYFSNTDALGELAADIPAREETVTGLPEGVTFDGATLSLKSQTTLSLYFVSEQELTLSIDGKTEGTDYELAHKGNEYVIRIRNIPASELNNDFTVKVNSTGSVTYSPMTYCYKAANSPTADSKLKNAVKALYQYWVEADKYFNTGGN